ncbi:KGK domain-containing protein [Brunnivagina elsteri]|uniref:KGK family protein n=1 Tax=Brunnivagina elsteri CCALA 953 TaxID=987040 RepID=A0A2A2TMR4_9CYAN|nr:KGK domain-containing protein [Calothrix elsteri]PAX59715.1 KGK family protein [Calothrix elsteri CCALA 953]
MEDKFKSIECNDDDVMQFGENTYKVDKLKQSINNICNDSLACAVNQELNRQRIQLTRKHPSATFFKDGVECKILNLGSKKWKKGRVKINISIEFYLDDEENNHSESSLDDLRQMFNETQS